MMEDTAAFGSRADELVRRAGAGILAGMLVGVAGGIGSRAIMRAAALAADHTPGFSVSGTLGVVLLGVLTGMPMGLLFAAAKPFLPGRGLAKGLMYGLVALPVFAIPIAVGNEELAIAPLLGLVLYAALFVASGVALAAVEGPIERRLGAPWDDARSCLGYGCLLLLGGIGTLFFALGLIAAITGSDF